MWQEGPADTLVRNTGTRDVHRKLRKGYSICDMNYGEIKKYDIANGEGVRVSLFVSGCTHHCKGCFNKETWDFSFGKPFTEETQASIMDALSHSYIDGLSLLGGEPFEPQNQRALLPFLKKVKQLFPDKNIWCYTGYTLESDLLQNSRARCECTDEMLDENL
jgi:anaerobic ribonucleoside-triphosphate reductase activating protein